MSENTFVTHLKYGFCMVSTHSVSLFLLCFFVFSYFLTLFYDAPFVPCTKDIEFLQKTRGSRRSNI